MKTYSIKASMLLFLFLFLSQSGTCQNNTDADDRMKIRLGFTSSNSLHRQILVTVDSNATPGVDFGYDAENFENHVDDMYWMIENRRFLIQGINTIDATTSLPIGLHTGATGMNIISIEGLVNVPEDLEIGLLDTETNTYYDMKQTSSVSIHLTAGAYVNRFTLKFANETINDSLNEEEEEEEISALDENITDTENEAEVKNTGIQLRYINSIKSISIKNIREQNIKHVNVYNMNGKLITAFHNINAIDQTLIQTYNINPGNYILLLTSDVGSTSKKISVQ
ncbi:T9SS type A sorting domain-containing protein [Lacinutrix sp. MEBiC02404]